MALTTDLMKVRIMDLAEMVPTEDLDMALIRGPATRKLWSTSPPFGPEFERQHESNIARYMDVVLFQLVARETLIEFYVDSVPLVG